MTHIRTLWLAGAAALLLATPAHAQRQVNLREDASASGTVEIEMNSGSVRIAGWSRNEVQVTGSLSRPDDRVEVERGGRTVEVRVTNRRGSRGGPANLEIRVPAGSTLSVTAGSAPITVSGMTGSVEAVSQSGPVTVTANARRVEVVAQSGPVTIEGQVETLDVTAMSGPVRVSANVRQIATIEALSGPVDVLGSVGEARINAVSGNVRVANASGGRVEIEAVSGNVALTGTRLRGSVQSVSGNVVVGGSVGGALTLESHGGNVEFRVPSGTNAQVQVETFSGSLRSDFGDGGSRGRERRVTIGRGGPTVTITTFSGDVKLLRR
jgi:DUF4097 and DUF4098 domain-containing protein YvlB